MCNKNEMKSETKRNRVKQRELIRKGHILKILLNVLTSGKNTCIIIDVVIFID